MTIAIERARMGKERSYIVEMDLDFCSRIYGETHENLILQSQTLDTTWTQTNVTIDADDDGTVAPNGTQTADKILTVANTTQHRIEQAVTLALAIHTYSIYLKRREHSTAYVEFRNATDGTLAACGVNLLFGLLTNVTGTCDIEEIANGWWRVSVTGTPTIVSNDFYCYSGSDDGTAFLGVATSGIYAWGAMVNTGSTAGHYVPTIASSVSASCTAALSAGNECYNTRITTQDEVNYTKLLKTIRFSTYTRLFPKSMRNIPNIVGKPVFTPTRIMPEKGLSTRSSVTFTIKDTPHHDRGLDPYVSTRNYTPEDQGTLLGKLLTRNRFWIGRTIRVLTGYATDPWDWNNFDTREYIIEKFDGPFRNVKTGDITYKITGKDILKSIADDRVQVPTPSTGTLASNLAIDAGSMTLNTGEGADYTSSGTVAIGAEIIAYATNVSDVLGGLTHAQGGTEDVAHNSGDTVQQCYVITSTNIVNVIYDLLVNEGGIPARYIPFTDGLPAQAWDDEKTNWLSGVIINTILHEPTGLDQLINEICDENQIDIWWEETTQEINLKTNTPPLINAPVTILKDDQNIIDGTFSRKELTDKRVSRVLFAYDKADLTENNDLTNFLIVDLNIDADKESTNQYGTEKLKQLKSRFMDASNTSVVSQAARRTLNRFGHPPTEIKFALDAKDGDVKTGDLVDIDSQYLQNFDGSNKVSRMQILQAKENGDRFDYVALSFIIGERNWFIGPNTLNDYSIESDDNKDAFAFIGPDTGIFADGGALYTII